MRLLVCLVLFAAWVVALFLNVTCLLVQGDTWLIVGSTCAGGTVHMLKHVLGLALMIPLVIAGGFFWRYSERIVKQIEDKFPE